VGSLICGRVCQYLENDKLSSMPFLWPLTKALPAVSKHSFFFLSYFANDFVKGVSSETHCPRLAATGNGSVLSFSKKRNAYVLKFYKKKAL